ncbi:hypothetical protein JCM11641_002036 [Rhodosporidiobolus odoratus]
MTPPALVCWPTWTCVVHKLRYHFDGPKIFSVKHGDPPREQRTAGWMAWEGDLDKVVQKSLWHKWANLERQSMVDEIQVLVNNVGRGKIENVLQLPSMNRWLEELPTNCPGLGRLLLVRQVNEVVATVSVPFPTEKRRDVYEDKDGVELEWRKAILDIIDWQQWKEFGLQKQKDALHELEVLKDDVVSLPPSYRKYGVLLLGSYGPHAARSPLTKRDGQPSAAEILNQLEDQFVRLSSVLDYLQGLSPSSTTSKPEHAVSTPIYSKLARGAWSEI